MDIDEWVTSYARAWETANEELIASLFTEDASYRSSPFREPFNGHAEIRAYWLAAQALSKRPACTWGGHSAMAGEWRSSGGQR